MVFVGAIDYAFNIPSMNYGIGFVVTMFVGAVDYALNTRSLNYRLG